MKAIDYEGSVAYGHNVGIGYFAQNQAEQLDPNQTIFEAVDQVAKGDIRLQIRSLLGTFLFSGEDIHKKVGILSGGERTRLALCQMLLSPSNFLILDEPTNHLDIPSKEILKNALINYEGTFIIVSHDREFLSGLTNRIWDIENQGLTIHHFELDEYLRHKAPKADHHSVQKNIQSPSITAPKMDQAGRERKNKLQKTERLIEETEGKLSELERQLVETQYHESNYNALISEYHSLKNKLDQLMDQWETLV